MSIEHEATVSTSSLPKPQCLRVFEKHREQFLAEVRAVIDGDTFHANVQLSKAFGMQWGGKVRVRNLYCPELREAGGPEALAAAKDWLMDHGAVALDCHGWDNHGRLLCDVYNQDGQNFSDWMIANGFGSKEPKATFVSMPVHSATGVAVNVKPKGST